MKAKDLLIEKMRRRVWSRFVVGLLLVPILPVGLVTLMKFVYSAPDVLAQFMRPFLSSLYVQYEVVRFVWPYAPQADYELALTQNNLLVGLVVVCVLLCFAAFGDMFRLSAQLSAARAAALQKDLEDGFRARDKERDEEE